MDLEQLITAQRTAANANTEAAVLGQTQALDSGLNTLTGEQGEIDPYYSTLINDTNKAYAATLGSTRSSAASRGAFWGSGGLSNKELSLGSENAGKVSEFGAERTRKLADISRRRSLLQKQTTENVNSLRSKGGADLEATIADLRYKDYQQKEAERIAREQADRDNAAAMARIYAGKADKADEKQTAEQAAADLIAQGGGWGDIANIIEANYGKIAPGSKIDQMLRQKFVGAETNYVAPTPSSGIFSNLFKSSGTYKAPTGRAYSIKDSGAAPSWANFGK